MVKPVGTWQTDDAHNALSKVFLGGIRMLDDMGAQSWNLFAFTAVTTVAMLVVRLGLGKKGGVDWLSFVHSTVTGYGSLVCVYLSVVEAESLTGTTEPLRSVTCQGALTSLHRIIPAITLAYGLFDLVEGFSHGIDFLAHGLATATIMAYFCYYDVAEIIVPMLLMEVSTVHLGLVRAKFFSDSAATVNMACFVVTFALCRLIAVPYFWTHIVIKIYQYRHTEIYQSCLPSHFHIMVLSFGIFFHCLNAYWFYKIVRKMKRKLSGAEKVKEGNELKQHGETLSFSSSRSSLEDSNKAGAKVNGHKQD